MAGVCRDWPIDAAGNLFTTDSHGSVQRISPTGTVALWAGNGNGGDGGPAVGAALGA